MTFKEREKIVADIFNQTWKEGWQLDLEYIVPRVVFHKNSGTCYMYNSKDIDDHLKTCGLNTLEYLEGKSFYREHCLELLQKRMENRVPSQEQERMREHNTTFHK